MKGNNILVFDTATNACTVALKTSNGIFSRHLEEPNSHSQVLLSMIDELLAEAVLDLKDIDYLAVGVGPGSFTGLRIGIGVAQGLAYSNGIRLIPISSLEMIAVNLLSSKGVVSPLEKIIVAHDARMSEVYTSTYIVEINSRLKSVSEVSVSSPIDVIISEGRVHLCGNAWQQYADQFNQVNTSLKVASENYFPCAKKTLIYIEKYLSLFETVDWNNLQPVYVRNNVAKKAKIYP